MQRTVPKTAKFTARRAKTLREHPKCLMPPTVLPPFLRQGPARCRHRRRRPGRPLCHPSPARHGPEGPGLRSGIGRRRDLVLEPLSRRALRRGEPGILLQLLQRAAAGMEVAGALRHAARDPEIHQPRRRPLRPAPRRAAQHAHRLGGVRRQGGRMDAEDRRRRGDPRALLRHGGGQPLDAARARLQGPEELQGQVVPLRPVAA